VRPPTTIVSNTDEVRGIVSKGSNRGYADPSRLVVETGGKERVVHVFVLMEYAKNRGVLVQSFARIATESALSAQMAAKGLFIEYGAGAPV